MSFRKRGFQELVDDILTELTGGIVNEPIRFVNGDAPIFPLGDAPVTRVYIASGLRRSGRAAYIDQALHENWGHAILLVPTGRAASIRLESILTAFDLPGAWGDPVQTFDDFARRIVESAHGPIHIVDDLERRLLFQRAIARLKDNARIEKLGAVVETPGFASHMLRTITQLKQAAVEPPGFREAAARREASSDIDNAVAVMTGPCTM